MNTPSKPFNLSIYALLTGMLLIAMGVYIVCGNIGWSLIVYGIGMVGVSALLFLFSVR